MKFSIGDKVWLKNTDEEGIVIAIIDEKMVEVEVNNISFPIYIEDLEHPYLNWFLKKKKNEKQNNIPTSQEALLLKDKGEKLIKISGFHLAFMPIFKQDFFENIVESIKVYFVNPTSITTKIAYKCVINNQCIFTLLLDALPNNSFYLHNINFDEISNSPKFDIHIYSPNSKCDDIQSVLRLKPKKLYEYLQSLLLKNEAFFTLYIADNFPEKQRLTTHHFMTKSIEHNAKEAWGGSTCQTDICYEIDLHIEKLEKNHDGMTNYEMLNIQLETFQRTLDNAYLSGQSYLTVIHGVGKGTLREEIHAILRSSHHLISHYHHGWMPRYGFGATQIFFK